jgi:hypothetical protein
MLVEMILVTVTKMRKNHHAVVGFSRRESNTVSLSGSCGRAFSSLLHFESESEKTVKSVTKNVLHCKNLAVEKKRDR